MEGYAVRIARVAVVAMQPMKGLPVVTACAFAVAAAAKDAAARARLTSCSSSCRYAAPAA